MALRGKPAVGVFPGDRRSGHAARPGPAEGRHRRCMLRRGGQSGLGPGADVCITRSPASATKLHDPVLAGALVRNCASRNRGVFIALPMIVTPDAQACQWLARFPQDLSRPAKGAEGIRRNLFRSEKCSNRRVAGRPYCAGTLAAASRAGRRTLPDFPDFPRKSKPPPAMIRGRLPTATDAQGDVSDQVAGCPCRPRRCPGPPA